MNVLGAVLLVLGFLARVQVHGIPALWLAAFTVAALAAAGLLAVVLMLVRETRQAVPA